MHYIKQCGTLRENTITWNSRRWSWQQISKGRPNRDCRYRYGSLIAAARLIARLPPYSHISAYMINDLYWLPILVPIRCKVLILVGKSQKGLAPKYLCELMCKPFSAGSSRPLHSADWFELLVPRWCTSLSQHLTFAVVGPSGPSLWNEWNDTPPGTCSLG